MAFVPAQKSSNVAGYDYDPLTKRLTVSFHGGSAYHYHDVPQASVDAFAKADSKGGYLSSKIRGVHRHTKQDD